MMLFSVLLSIYHKEDCLFLRQALDSIFSQTLRAAQVVIVEDGPLTEELYKVLDEYAAKNPEVERVPLSQNGGLGKALNEGLKRCRYELVARMDTDDISHPDRFEKQVAFMQEHQKVDAMSSWIDEFVDNPTIIRSARRLPETSEELFSFGKKRNPINHPVVMFRKSAVLRVGGYQHCPLFEDYHLWVRMLMDGCKLYNIQESLLSMRTNENMFMRRGGADYVKKEMNFLKFMHKIGYISLSRLVLNILERLLVRIIPNHWRAWVYKLVRK